MREIKFRGKRVSDGKWVYGFLIGSDVIVGDVVDFNDDYFNTEFWYKVLPETVGQYVGLRDRSAVGVYEGDIVRFGYHESVVSYVEDRKVTYGHGDCGETFFIGFFIGSSYGKDNDFFILGNIHDNKELIKK